MSTTTESIRTMFGSSRRLKCSRCKDFSTANQAAYSAHLRECSGGTTPTTTSVPNQPLQNQPQQPLPASTSPSVPNSAADSLVAAGLSNLFSGSFVDPIGHWQKLMLESAKHIQQNQGLGLPQSLVSAFSNAANLVQPPPAQVPSPAAVTPTPSSSGTGSKKSNSNQNNRPLPVVGEEISSGERYGFREVFKHMYTAMVNGSMAYCCRLCPYQHAVRSRVTKHIRLQHFSKQQLQMFTCELCSFTTQHATELEHHRRRHAVNTKVYKCSECEYSTPMQNNFKRHLRRHTSSDAFVCSNCSFSSPHEATVKRHAFLYHRGQNQQASGQNDAPSQQQLSQQQTRDFSNVENSVSLQSDEALKLDDTGKSSSSPSVSDNHNATSASYVCDICSIGFSSLGAFSQHRAFHEFDSTSGASALDLRCSSSPDQKVQDPVVPASQPESDGILNLSTKAGVTVKKGKQSAPKRRLPQTPSGSSLSPEMKIPREISTTAPSSHHSISDGESEPTERRYGCPVCAFEDSQKAVVSLHLSTAHPNQAATRKSSTASQLARNATAAMLPIRCFSVPKQPSTPLVISCEGKSERPLTPEFKAPVPAGLPTPPASQGNSTPSSSPVVPKSSVMFKCSVCGLRNVSRKLLRSHAKIVHRRVTNVQILGVQTSRYQQINAGQTSRKRKITPADKPKLARHLAPKLLNCRKCLFHTRSVDCYLQHCRSHFVDSNVEIGCKFCSFSSHNQTVLENHELLWHGKVKSQPRGFKCSVCDLELPKADDATVKQHVASAHVPQKLLDLGAVRLDLLYVEMS